MCQPPSPTSLSYLLNLTAPQQEIIPVPIFQYFHVHVSYSAKCKIIQCLLEEVELTFIYSYPSIYSFHILMSLKKNIIQENIHDLQISIKKHTDTLYISDTKYVSNEALQITFDHRIFIKIKYNQKKTHSSKSQVKNSAFQFCIF